MKQVQHPHKIPVVDDEPDVEPLVLQRLRRNIRSGQYRFVFARNGVEALQRLRQETDIDMVLSDINMPQMDGLTLLEQIPKVDPNVFGHMEPARAVGGDFFDIMPLADGRIGLAIADVSDKGVPAALFMMSTRTLLKGAAVGLADPAEVLREVDDLLNDDNEASMFVTVPYATFDPASGEFTYANGGHNSPLMVRADGSSELLPLTDGIALGVVPDLHYGQKAVSLEPGDTLVLYTDGVTEAMNSADEEFGVQRLRAVFASGPPGEGRATSQAVFDAVHAFAGDTPQSDDVTCLALCRGGFGH